MAQVHLEDPNELEEWRQAAIQEDWSTAQASIDFVLQDPEDTSSFLGWCDECGRAIAWLDALYEPEPRRATLQAHIREGDLHVCGDCYQRKDDQPLSTLK